jgi:hypothetical protein
MYGGLGKVHTEVTEIKATEGHGESFLRATREAQVKEISVALPGFDSQ